MREPRLSSIFASQRVESDQFAFIGNSLPTPAQLFEEFGLGVAFVVLAGRQKQEIVLLGQHGEPLADGVTII